MHIKMIQLDIIGVPERNIQKIQNHGTELVFKIMILKSLHWNRRLNRPISIKEIEKEAPNLDSSQDSLLNIQR